MDELVLLLDISVPIKIRLTAISCDSQKCQLRFRFRELIKHKSGNIAFRLAVIYEKSLAPNLCAGDS